MKKFDLILNNLYCGKTRDMHYLFSDIYNDILLKSSSFGWHYAIYPYCFDRHKGLGNYLIFFTLDGNGHILYNGKEYSALKNTVTILPPFFPHKYFVDKESHWEFYWVHIEPYGIKNFIDSILAKQGVNFQIQGIDKFGKYIENMLESPYIGIENEIYISRQTSELLHDLFYASVVNYSLNSDNNNFVKEVIDYISQNYMNQITIQNISEKLFMSPCYIIRNFKKYTGYTPYAYLKKYRLMKSIELLSATNFQIKEVAAMVGYNSVSHFISEFKDEKDVTPNEFRQKIKIIPKM